MMEIDWGNPGFLRLYGLIFGLATVLTMIMWLIAVVKRVVRGVPVAQAAMEDVSYLLMSVAVAGFAPVAVAYTVDFVDSAAKEILGDYIAEVFVGGLAIFTCLAAITILLPGVGAIIAIPIALMLLLSLFGLWVTLIVRNAMILMGLVFGPLVFSGLVDKDLWGHTRKWVGIMGGIIASKLGIYLALALAGAMLDGVAQDIGKITLPQAIGACITFLALFLMALIMPFQIAKWLPFVGDEIQSMHQVKSEAVQRHRSTKAGIDDMKTQAASKSSAGGGADITGGGVAGAAAGPATIKLAADNVRDQTVQAAQDGANNASGNGGQQGSGNAGGGGAGDGSSPVRRGGSPRGGSSGGRPVGGTPSSGTRRTAPPPPRSGGRRPTPPPPPPTHGR